MSVLEARELVRRFPASALAPEEVAAVRGVNLAVGPGELVCVAGPSGSGKTTLLHLLATLDTPTSGSVRLLDREVSALPRRERARLRLAHVGLVFSEHNLSPGLTVAENVDLPLALAGRPADERRARTLAALERLGIAHLARRFPDALSSGEQQRAAVARAIAGSPSVLIADEPTAHLDGASAEALVALLAELVAERRYAAVVASHDERVLRRSARVLHLRDGRVAEPVA